MYIDFIDIYYNNKIIKRVKACVIGDYIHWDIDEKEKIFYAKRASALCAALEYDYETIRQINKLQAKNSDKTKGKENYKLYATSDDEILKMLTAANGKYLDVLCKDKSIDVRLAVVRHNEEYINKMLNDENWQVRAEIAKMGINLENYINDENWVVRKYVAMQGYGIDKLMYDKDANVRAAIARQGHYLSMFIGDKAAIVRRAVASRGYGLVLLIKDKDPIVRCAVAEQGFHLEILIKDPDWQVRLTALDNMDDPPLFLLNDKHKVVRKMAKEKIKKDNVKQKSNKI